MQPRLALQSRLRNLKQENPMNANHYIGFDVHKKTVSYCVSRQSEKFLIGQSRKFLLTAENWKDGTNRDEPGGTRLAGVAEAGAGRCRHAAARRREDGRQRPVGAKIAGAHEDRWRRGCRARTTGPVVEPADRRADAGACRGVAEAAGVARLRTDVRQPAV